jgi:hypothetical protein
LGVDCCFGPSLLIVSASNVVRRSMSRLVVNRMGSP